MEIALGPVPLLIDTSAVAARAALPQPTITLIVIAAQSLPQTLSPILM